MKKFLTSFLGVFLAITIVGCDDNNSSTPANSGSGTETQGDGAAGAGSTDFAEATEEAGQAAEEALASAEGTLMPAGGEESQTATAEAEDGEQNLLDRLTDSVSETVGGVTANIREVTDDFLAGDDDIPQRSLPSSPDAINTVFMSYLDLPQGATPEEIEASATAVVTEIFNEPGMAQGKVWQMQQKVGELQEDGAYSEEYNRRVRILASGIQEVVHNNQRAAIAEDVAIMAGISLGVAVVGAKGPWFKEKIQRGFSAIGRTLSAAGTKTRNGFRSLGALGKKDTYTAQGQKLREQGKRIEEGFKATFHRLPPEQTLARNFAAVGLDDAQIAMINKKPMELLTQSQVDDLAVTFESTALKNLQYAAVAAEKPSPRISGYFIFRQKNYAKDADEPYLYFQTRMLTEKQSVGVYQTLAGSSSSRSFVEMITGAGKSLPTRAQVAGSVKHGVEAAAHGVSNGAKSAAHGVSNGVKSAANGVKNAASGTVSGVANTVRSSSMRQAGKYFLLSFAGLGTGYYFGRDTQMETELHTQHLYELEERIIEAIEVAEASNL